jgi:hypothetical protein
MRVGRPTSGLKFLRVDLILRRQRRSPTCATFTELILLPLCCPLYHERCQIYFPFNFHITELPSRAIQPDNLIPNS